ncbi:MAG TPA: biopolymer transporter ExbD [Thermoanaerobaculia bacterium]|nr:biopolymer transporter ExbD [Thermoanaerobaculia bacterium]
MGMSAGASGDYKSDINITPLVDVVLVLLIIFMVITPLLQMGYDVKVPPKATVDNPHQDPDQLIVSLTAQNKTFLNKQELTLPQLATQLTSILKNRRDKTVFFSGDDGATYGDVAKVMDLCRSAGATNIGIVLETVPIQ